jgi:hypothetical protein
MAWTAPGFSKGQVDSAGRALADGTVRGVAEDGALEILNNWRASHSFPLNTFAIGLKEKSRRVDPHALVAQRLKRTPSVVQKLRRFPKMQLSRMQDIGGCRAVVMSATEVQQLHADYRKSQFKHLLVNQKDYIAEPKGSGYRGIHLVYRYRSDRKHTYNGLQVEVQLRSRIQHAWATAVETVGTFLRESLKSSEGPEQWLEFFKLTGSAFALLEDTPLVPGTPQERSELIEVTAGMAENLEVAKKLANYGLALQTLEHAGMKGAHYFLLELRPAEETLTVTGYRANQLTTATADYLSVEKALFDAGAGEAVLVAAESVDSLRRAYPNYFLDTQTFVEEMQRALQQ